MPLYRYRAVGFQGRQVAGTRSAPHVDALVAQLEQEGLRVVSFAEGLNGAAEESSDLRFDDEAPATPLTNRQAAALSGHLAEVVAADLPLESGLAALAEDLPSRRMRRVLRQVVGRLDGGADLSTALAQAGAPPYLRAVVEAGGRSGCLGIALERYSNAGAALMGAAPLVVCSALYATAVFLIWLVVVWLLVGVILPGFAEMFQTFGLTLPWLTRAVIWVGTTSAEYWLPLTTGLVAGGAMVGLSIRLAAGPVGTRRILHRVPGFGTIVRSLALCRFSTLLALLVDCRTPMPEALRLSAEATGDAAVNADARRLAELTAEGETALAAACRLQSFSPGFVRALAAPYGPECLVDGLQSLAEVHSGRIRVALSFLATVLAPLVLVILGLFTAVVVIALYLPLVELLHSLV